MLLSALKSKTGVDSSAPVSWRNKMLPDLSALLEYKNIKVIKSYMRNYLTDEIKANELFNDMIRYLWLCQKLDLDKKLEPDNQALQFQLVMHEEMRDMDNMWHNFILYTHDYTDFCNQSFGEYLHHVPDIADTITQTNEEFANDLEKYLSYVYDHLGEETVRRWFATHLTQD